MNQYLVWYNRRTGKGAVIGRYTREQDDTAARVLLALEIGKPSFIEVVILEADSEEAIRETHGRYFKTLRELVLGA